MSKSLFTTIIEEIAPTTETVGVVGQLYLDSVEKKLYQCVAITTETVDEVEVTRYEWKAVGSANKLYAHTITVTTSSVGSTFKIVSYFVNNVAEPFTDKAILSEWLYNNGYTSNSKYIMANGGNSWVTGYEYLGLYSSDGTTLCAAVKGVSSIEIDGKKFITNVSANYTDNILGSSYYISDNVIEL